ncbi:cAMP-independent regulatory protein pac2 [Cytospora mali]|uniref:cAMP-independent regulatory protein pac2 n=1 Tax=Cytospora mali TaxID=578113 RepID=A0A194W796_CYTMA|nr:cAMP-independent regulatory protein pac2 [Valsa mali]
MAVRQSNMMETYHGLVRTPADAIKLFEACRVGLLPRVQRRLSEKERQSIRSGSVFVWDEREAGMRRWTDGKSWSASRVSGSFLTYREMEGKRGGGFGTSRRSAGKTPDSGGGSDVDPDDGEPDGYRYKADGLMKQSFSITTSQGQHLHLISYYSRPHPNEPELPQPSTDPSLRHIVPVKGMYPESSMNEQPVPAMTRTPMASAYAPPPPHPAYHPQYAQQPYPGWPPSPVATPPYSHYTVSAHYPPTQLPPPGAYPPHPHHYMQGPPTHHPMIKEESPRPQHMQLKAAQAVSTPPGPGRSMPGPLPSVHASTPPPRAVSQSPPNGGSNKASLSALLHPNPTPSNSEPNSASAGGNNSATSSPRGNGAAVSGGAAAGLMAKGFHEDARALDVLNKKFSI